MMEKNGVCSGEGDTPPERQGEKRAGGCGRPACGHDQASKLAEAAAKPPAACTGPGVVKKQLPDL